MPDVQYDITIQSTIQPPPPSPEAALAASFAELAAIQQQHLADLRELRAILAPEPPETCKRCGMEAETDDSGLCYSCVEIHCQWAAEDAYMERDLL